MQLFCCFTASNDSFGAIFHNRRKRKKNKMTKATNKNLIAFLVVLVLSISTSITVFADTSTSAQVSSVTTVSRGEEITFTVGISNGTEVQSILIIPSYDSNVFELISGAWTLSGEMISDFSVSSGDGVILFNPGINVDGTVLTFTLKAKDDAVFGTYTISAEVIITDSNGNSMLNTSGASVQIKCNHSFTKVDTTYLKSEATCTSPTLYYKSCVTCGAQGTETFEYGTTLAHTYNREVVEEKYLASPASCTAKAKYYKSCSCGAQGTETFEVGDVVIRGDTNGDERITKDDAIYILMNTFFAEDYPANQDFDFDKDSSVTKDDAIYVLMYTFFPDNYPID